MRKNTTTPMLKSCIMESLLLLLRDKSMEDISVKEIVAKAGVNRSTYYRHFESKLHVVRYFYECRLEEALEKVSAEQELEQYFSGIFLCFLQYKKELIMLDRLGLSYLLLEILNFRMEKLCDSNVDAVKLLYCNYHVGGVFNSFRYWLRENMVIPPEELARQCVQILPRDFSPWLSGQAEKSNT